MPMAMSMAVAMEARATEAAIDGAAIGPAVQASYGLQSGATAASRTKPIDTALTAALPINVSTTRRERFMWRPSLFEDPAFQGLSPGNRFLLPTGP